MSIYIISRRVLGPMLTQIKLLSKDSKKYIKTFKTVNVNVNQPFTHKPKVVKLAKCGNRNICRTCRPLEGLCIPAKLFPDTESKQIHWISQTNAGYIRPIARYPGFPGMVKTPIPPFVGNWKWYAQTQAGKGGGVRESGGRIGKLDSANEDGFFHKLNKSRLEETKKMLKEKSLLKGSDTRPSKK